MKIIKFIEELAHKSQGGIDGLDNAGIAINLTTPVEGSDPSDSYMSGGWDYVALTDIHIVDESGIMFLAQGTYQESKKLVYVPWTAVSNIIFK